MKYLVPLPAIGSAYLWGTAAKIPDEEGGPDRKVAHGRVVAKETAFMASLEIRIDYLADRPELLEELARLSWKEWQEVYQQRDQAFADSLKNYRERMNTDRCH